MAVKLDQIVSHVEEVHFKLPSRNFSEMQNSSISYNNTKLNNQENRPNFDNHQLVTISHDVIRRFFCLNILQYKHLTFLYLISSN
jgi:hypothetical protein